MEKLTLAAVCDLAKGQDIREIKILDASRKGIKHVDDIRYSNTPTFRTWKICHYCGHP